jgi:uncharacterized repeat protein (TIGR03803 family)
MFRIRSIAALCALGLFAMAGHAQTAPAVSTAVAFSLSSPVGNPVQGPDGAIYGMTNPATSFTGGLIFRAALDGSDVRTLYQMTDEDGIAPGAGLTVGSDGLLYGTTKFGKAGDVAGAGTVFKIAPNGTGFQVIFRFASITGSTVDLNPINTDGAYPEGELVEGADGYLYGATRSGGPNGTGAIFKVSRDGTDFQLLHAFAADTSPASEGTTVTVDGAAPTGRLVQGADGNLYGTTSSGGTNGRGTVFRLGFDGTGFQVLHHFTVTTTDTTSLSKNADGALPFGGLVDGDDGFFYGMTSQGGPNGYGTIYALPADGSTFTVLHAFNNTDGARPLAELMRASDGKLYGTTSIGGVTSSGTVTALGTFFSIDRAGTNFSLLRSFEARDGTGPQSDVLETATGVFFGFSSTSGNCGYGTIWRYSMAGDTVTGNTRCGQKKNNNSGGGGGLGFGALLLLGGLGLARRRAA